MMRQSVHDLTGESLDETYSINKDGQEYSLTLKNPDTNFAKIVDRTNNLYQEGRIKPIDVATLGISTFFGSEDKTVRNESQIRKRFSDDEYREFASNNLSYLDNTVAGNNSIRIKGNEKKIVDPIYEEVLAQATHAAFDKKLPIDIYKRENGELFISQTVKDKTVNKDGLVTQQAEYNTATIPANDVAKMTQFNNQISLLQKENTFKTLEDISGKVERMNFIGDNREQVEGLNRLYDKNNKGENTFRLLSAHKTARDMIFNPSVSQYMPPSHPIRIQFEDFVTNTQNYKLDFTKGVDSDYQVLIKDKDGNDIGSVPLHNNIPIETFEKAYSGTPQVFLSLYSKSRVDKYIQSLINGG